jgi:tyrosyl-tRNA synthetase
MRLATDIVRQFHGAEAARTAEAEFVRIFQQRELPTEMPVYELANWTPLSIVDLLKDTKLASSASAARRLIEQGGVRINDEKVEDIGFIVRPEEGMILRVGKRNFVKLVRRPG